MTRLFLKSGVSPRKDIGKNYEGLVMLKLRELICTDHDESLPDRSVQMAAYMRNTFIRFVIPIIHPDIER